MQRLQSTQKSLPFKKMAGNAVLERIVPLEGNGFQCSATVIVRQSHAADIDFVHCGTPYTFCITKWRGRGKAAFMQLFYSKPRNSEVFGVATWDDDGMPLLRPSATQTHEAVVQGCVDILACVDRILKVYGQSIQGYAAWYNNLNLNDYKSYEIYIARLACRCIADCRFTVASSTWAVVL